MRSRILLVATAAGISLATWGFAPTAARSPKTPSGTALVRLTEACEQALRARLPHRGALAVTGPARVEAAGSGAYRLLSAYQSGGGRTSFSCDAFEDAGDYEVAALTLVQW